jgi:hypothetical protein
MVLSPLFIFHHRAHREHRERNTLQVKIKNRNKGSKNAEIFCHPAFSNLSFDPIPSVFSVLSAPKRPLSGLDQVNPSPGSRERGKKALSERELGSLFIVYGALKGMNNCGEKIK